MAGESTRLCGDIADRMSKLPWWVGILFSLLSFLVLHWYAAKEFSVSRGGEGINDSVLAGILCPLVFYGQFVIPALFLSASLVAVTLKYKQKKLYGKTSRGMSQGALDDLSRRDFKYLMEEYFRRRGFRVEEGGTGPDGGFDLIAGKDREKYLVQCKHWKTCIVGVEVVRELLGVMIDAGATGGIVVTSGGFAKAANSLARANNIQLLDGRELYNSMKSDDIYERPLDRRKRGALGKIKWAVAGFLAVFICFSVFHPGQSGRSVYSTLSAQLKRFFPNCRERRETKDEVAKKPVAQPEGKDLRFTDDEIKRAMEEVLSKKKNQQ